MDLAWRESRSGSLDHGGAVYSHYNDTVRSQVSFLDETDKQKINA